jgi:hypothetical protein
LEFRRVVQVLGDRPGDRESVEGAGAAPDLVEDHEALARGVREDLGGLAHLDHEGGLAAREPVRGADPCEDAVDDPHAGGLGRHEAADLREQREQRDLAQVGALAGHVGTGERHQQLRVVGIELRVVRDVFLAALRAQATPPPLVSAADDLGRRSSAATDASQPSRRATSASDASASSVATSSAAARIAATRSSTAPRSSSKMLRSSAAARSTSPRTPASTRRSSAVVKRSALASVCFRS